MTSPMILAWVLRQALNSRDNLFHEVAHLQASACPPALTVAINPT